MPYPLNNLFQLTWNGQKHISGLQNHPSVFVGSWVIPWSSHGTCCWHCFWSDFSETCSNQPRMVKNIYLDTKINLSRWHCSWCWCTSDSSVTCSNQLSMVKNIYLDTKINLLQCQGAELHLEVAPDHVVGILNFSRFSSYVPGAQKWFNW